MRLVCGCCDSQTPRSKIVERHGSLESFTEAMWAACNDLFITQDEAQEGIREYKEDLDEAPIKDLEERDG